MAWYKKTAVWGIIISVSALILSQLPPVGSWLARSKIEAEVGKRIGLPNTIGIAGFQIFLDLKNGGNRTINISKLRLEVIYPDGLQKRLEAQSYSKLITGQAVPLDFPITSVTLPPEANWAELVAFSPNFSPSDEEEISRLRLQISQSIFSEIQAGAADHYGQAVEAEAPLVAEAEQFFDRKFDLEKGTYRACAKCDADGKEVVLKEASFTLYDYHIGTIKSQKEDFKFGAGIYFPTNVPKQVWALISEVE